MSTLQETSENLFSYCGDKRHSTIYADPPWRFQNRTGKVAPENKKLNRYETMPLEDIMALPIEQVAAAKKPFVSLGSQCSPAGWSGCYESVGI